TEDGGFTGTSTVWVKEKIIDNVSSGPNASPNYPIPREPELNKAMLIASIEKFTAKVSGAIIGDKPGQYPAIAVDALWRAIDKANEVIKNVSATQVEIDNALAKLNQAFNDFESQIIKHSVKIAFKDTANHWAEQYINKAIEIGLFKGYSDGTFRPSQQISRAEFITILARVLQLSLSENEDLTFTDRSQIPAYAVPYITAAVHAQLVEGYTSGTFRPQVSITRAEAAVLIARTLDINSAETGLLDFIDAEDIPLWAQPSILAIVKSGIMEGRDGNRFAPHAGLTRAEAVKLILSLFDSEHKSYIENEQESPQL
ncbi:S-layer homology domain-containing protein, partial [Paenibacillus sp. ISL-20]|uniref:S-layer homology domain-containing protein n=1 Tax=Paenibacillus sp. ISL-20 TaxID=2819163 RepID=UPI001BEAEA88